MNFNRIAGYSIILKNILLPIIIIFSSCQNDIIERSANDYFPIAEGNWWFYSNDDLYNPISINIAVESSDTILNRECYPFNVSGEFHYYSKDRKGIKEYIKFTRSYGGFDYTILEGFITRLELPLVSGNRFTDSLVDSLDFFGEQIRVRYLLDGYVSEIEHDEIFGEIYKVILSEHQSIIIDDSTITAEDYIEEYYGPGIGLIKFKDTLGVFKLKDFHIE